MGCYLFIVSTCGQKGGEGFYIVIVHCVAYYIKQSRTVSPILNMCVGETLKARQGKILSGIWTLLAWNGHSLYWE